MDFSALKDYMRTLSAQGIPGCEIRVWQDHKPVLRFMTGESRPDEPMRGDETYWLYSSSKVFCMTASMQLIERGIIGLDDPVGKYLPEYAEMTVRDGDTVRPAKNVMTVRHLMTMCGGLDYDLNAPEIQDCVRETNGQATTRQVIAALAKKPLNFEPGSHMMYSLCHDVMAAVIEVASGMTYGEYLTKEIFVPLGITDITMHPTKAQLDRIAAQYIWNEPHVLTRVNDREMAYRLTDPYESGGAGLMGSADAYIRLADALACGGVAVNGNRILTPASIDLMRTDQMNEITKKDFDTIGRIGYSYGLGVRTMVDNSKAKSPLGEFGWDSAGGAWVMVDPERKLSAFYAQHVLNCGYVYDVVHPTVRDLIYTGLEV